MLDELGKSELEKTQIFEFVRITYNLKTGMVRP